MTILIFLGTKGEIEEKSRRHKYHSSILMIKDNFRLMIDFGLIHRDNLQKIKPDAVLITHAHPDHYIWTKKGYETDIPVYVTKSTINYGKFKPENYKIISENKKIKLSPFSILPYKVLHSVRCPAVGFRISFGKNVVIYNPDLVDIINRDKILKNARYYIGDGSSINANLVRKRNEKIFGHSRITTQVKWCEKAGIKKIIFTHLGKETIAKEKSFKNKHPEIIFAYDGMRVEI